MFDVATCFVHHSAISPSSYVSGNISVDDHIMPLCFVIGFCLRLSSLHQIMQYPKSGWLFLILHIFRKRLPQILSLNHWSSYLQSFRCPNKTVENKFATIHISQHINIIQYTYHRNVQNLPKISKNHAKKSSLKSAPQMSPMSPGRCWWMTRCCYCWWLWLSWTSLWRITKNGTAGRNS